MRIHGQEDGPADAEDREVFKALHLAGSGKVRATVEERMLWLENKRGHGLDIQLSNISRVHHHHTRLIPFSFALIGAGLIWMAQRILIPPSLRMTSAAIGACLILGWIGTRKPTLTLDTISGGCHTLTGHDSSLMRLSTLLKRLQDGMSIEDARIGLDIFDRETPYPRNALSALTEVPVEPIHMNAPVSIGTFLNEHLDADDVPSSVASFDMFSPEGIDLDFQEPNLDDSMPGWMTGEQDVGAVTNVGHGLLERGIANAHDRRNNHLQSATQVQHQNQFIAHPDAPVQAYPVQQPMPSYQQLLQASQTPLPTHNTPQHSNQTPSGYLPSFVGREGAHIPGMHQSIPLQNEANAFRSPDSLLPSPDIEDSTSLIEAARRAEPIETPIVQTAPSQKPVKTNSRLRPKSVNRSDSRLRPKVRSDRNRRLRVRDLVIPSASQLLDDASEYASRIFSGKNSGEHKQTTSTTDQLRQRSSETHQDEAIESIKNLAQSRGGNLPDEEIGPMLDHLTRRHSLLEQQEQAEEETAPELEDITFGDLKESEQHYADHAGKAGLPRIDF